MNSIWRRRPGICRQPPAVDLFARGPRPIEPSARSSSSHRLARAHVAASRSRSSLFPFGPTMISMSVELSGGRSVEVASIGREGAVGGIVSCGHAPAFSSAVVLVGGPALRVPMRARRGQEALDLRREHFLPLLRLSALAGDAVGGVQCVPFDRAGRALVAASPRTAPATRSSSRRTRLRGCSASSAPRSTRSIQTLSGGRARRHGRGAVRVVDRAGLKRCSCECYEQIEDHFGAVIGVTGAGAV